MKKKIMSFVVMLFVMLVAVSLVSAHELRVEVWEEGDELRVDVIWGHIYDFVDLANIEQYELFMRTPAGSIEQLELESVGAQIRAYVPSAEEGEYVFWSLRAPSLYTPTDGVPTLSVQMAKTTHLHGAEVQNSTEPVNMDLELIPDTDLSTFESGEFHAHVLLEGDTIEGAAINAYGPQNHHLEAVSDAEGAFHIHMDVPGQWVVKANIQSDEGGELDDGTYELVSQTTTFYLDTDAGQQAVAGTSTNGAQSSAITFVILFVCGLLVGAAAAFAMKRKKTTATE